MRIQVSFIILAIALSTPGARLLAQDHLTPERAAAARQALRDWFECIECTAGELKTLTAFGPAVEGVLISTLRDGLSPVKRAELEQQLRDTYRTSGHLPMTEAQFVRTYLSNADAAYRSRAATALGQLRTQNAKDALTRARANSDLRPEVRDAAQKALDAMPVP